jgi:hypothetical protein
MRCPPLVPECVCPGPPARRLLDETQEGCSRLCGALAQGRRAEAAATGAVQGLEHRARQARAQHCGEPGAQSPGTERCSAGLRKYGEGRARHPARPSSGGLFSGHPLLQCALWLLPSPAGRQPRGYARRNEYGLSSSERRTLRELVASKRRALNGRLDVRWLDFTARPVHVVEPDGRVVLEGATEGMDKVLCHIPASGLA